MKAVNNVASVTEMALDGAPVARRSVGDHDLDLGAPAPSLGREKARQGTEIAVTNDPDDLASLAIGDHGDVAVPAPERGLVDQQHPAGPLGAPLGQ
ncbi:hypothetical protein BH20ACT22_BH20ACT22_25170 [soil metagenome]